MRVVFLNATGQLGGAERVLSTLLRALRQAKPDWDLQVITGDDGPLVAHLTGLGFALTVLPMPEKLANLGERSSRNPLALLRALGAATSYRATLKRALESKNPDIVHSMNFKAHLMGALARVKGAKLCWHIHDFVSNRALTSKLLRAMSPRADAVIAISESVAADMRRVSKAPERVRTVMNAINLEHFSPDGPKQELRAPSVGLVATYARWKGHDVFLRAVASLPFPVHAYIAGGGLYRTPGSQVTREDLAARAAELGLAGGVTFTGFLEDTAPLLRGLDVVVHASTEPEPFGLAIAEGMACGRAVIASMAGGAAEILTPEVNGLGHAPGDAEGLALAMRRLIEDPALRQRLGEAARRSAVAIFDPARMARETIAVYEGLAA